MAEVFFQLLKGERIDRKIAYIEILDNPVWGHGNNGNLSPVEYERQTFRRAKSV